MVEIGFRKDEIVAAVGQDQYNAWRKKARTAYEHYMSESKHSGENGARFSRQRRRPYINETVAELYLAHILASQPEDRVEQPR
ncbi:hypothetical protein COU60_03055 [Candidatus Pacearchaeota archaeon CG10_big_fil_rev_8_21_14_0_10_34_76]|nr:MAG: hypothetical protein COU60_03055 [Candidatus Pacearchaeota archaeon CG10_big_fil_rev_8_21_14_0_10_34_76]